MHRHLIRFGIPAFFALGLLHPGAGSAQATNAESLERWIRSGYEFEWERGQPVREAVREVWGQLGSGGVGYGFRTVQVRRGPPDSVPEMESWCVRLDELHTSVVGATGLAWGVHTETFKVEGQPSATVRVRFTNTLRWTGQGWENLLYHRDAQEFGEDGRYRNSAVGGPRPGGGG